MAGPPGCCRLMARLVTAYCEPVRGAVAIRRCTDAPDPATRRNVRPTGGKGGSAMSTPVMASERDLHALAGIVTSQRADVPAEGLPESLLSELKDQIRCDFISLQGIDSGRRQNWLSQTVPDDSDEYDGAAVQALDRAHWEHYWDSAACSYPDRTGDLRSVLTVADFHSARQWHATGMYTDVYRPQGIEHELQLCLPEPPGRATGPGRTVRLYAFRSPGPDFSERDRALLTLLRPHLHEAYLDAERCRHPVPRLTPRQTD